MSLFVLIVWVLLAIGLFFLIAQYYCLRRDAEQERCEFEQILNAVSDAVMVINLQGRIVMLNGEAQKLTGWTHEEAVGRNYSQVYGTEHATANPLARVLDGETTKREDAILRSKVGQELEITEQMVPLFGARDQVSGVICTFVLNKAKEELRTNFPQLAFRDSLTGLYNRAFFEQELPRLDQPEHWPLSVLVGDLNGLKLTNDVFGHSVGDELLVMVSQAFLDVCRPEDRVFRWGGDEFIVLLPETGRDKANEIRERLQLALRGRAVGAITVDLPLGCSTKEGADQDMQAIWQEAEREMYEMKTTGHTDFQKETLEGIISVLHERSSAEQEHAERVSALAEEFGEFLGLTTCEVRNLRLCGLLHDIGKVVLEPELLRKPYPLKPEDDYEVRRHPIVGFRLLSVIDDTADLAGAILAHHERWDGGGYPKGLKGEEIPYFGRILAVLETYDRVHNISHDRALELISEGAGSKFDPSLSRAFLQMMEIKNKSA